MPPADELTSREVHEQEDVAAPIEDAEDIGDADDGVEEAAGGSSEGKESGAQEVPVSMEPVMNGGAAVVQGRKSLADRAEAFVSRLSTKNNFWHRICSLIWLPYAFRSGIRMKRMDEKTFTAVLPFRKFNRNWYNAMAGAALLGNSEIAGGMYVFGVCGGEYTVVCKHLEYRFMRPCFGPAIYRIVPREDLKALAALHKEFNAIIDMDVVQQLPRADALPRVREKRVGKVTATFHVTPKAHQKKKGRFGRGKKDRGR